MCKCGTLNVYFFRKNFLINICWLIAQNSISITNMSHILGNQTVNSYTPFTSRIYHMHIRLMFCASYSYRDQSVNAPCQWEMTLQCNAVSHWLGVYTEWSMHLEQYDKVCSVIVLTILFIYYVQKCVIIKKFAHATTAQLSCHVQNFVPIVFCMMHHFGLYNMYMYIDTFI